MRSGCLRPRSAVFLVLLLALSALSARGALGAPTPAAPLATAHAPIVIEGNAGFTSANGVASGSGTASKPYVIGPWMIDGMSAPAVQIRNTTAFFVLQDVNVSGADPWGFSSPYDAVTFTNVVHGSAVRLNLSGVSRGIVLEGGSFLSVADSAITNTPHDALVASRTNNLSLMRNDFRGWTNLYGVHLIDVPNATLGGNLFDFGSVFLDTAKLSVFDTTSITPDNLVGGLPIRYYHQTNGLIVDSLPTAQLIVADSTDVRVSNVSVAYGETGFQFAFVRGLSLIVSSSSGARRVGLSLSNVSDAWVSYVSAMYSSGPSALMTNVTNVTVASSTLLSSAGSSVAVTVGRDVHFLQDVVQSEGLGAGLALDRVDGFSVAGSNLSHNLVGLSLVDGANGSVTGNDFYANGPVAYGYPTGEGLYAEASRDVVLEVNNFTANGWGAWATRSTALRFDRNWFVGNYRSAADDSTGDLWNDSYPAGGNYWSDYHGYDDCKGPLQDDCTGGDGLGDTPYGLATSPDQPLPTVLDHYPLVFVNPPNAPPVAEIAVSNPTPWTGETITIGASSAYDPDGFVTDFAWTLGDGWTASGPVVQHAYAAPGNYTATLTVTDNRHATNTTSVRIRVTTWVRPSVPLVVWSSPKGYALPIPSGWSRQENVSMGTNTTLDLVAVGTYNGTPANLVVSEAFDPTVREDRTYLVEVLNATVTGLQKQYPGVVVTRMTFRTLSGHTALVAVIEYGSFYQDVAITTSVELHAGWLIILTATASEEANLDGTYQQMLDGFTITATPPGGGASGFSPDALLLWAVVGGATGAVIAAAVGLVLYARRKSRPRPPMPPLLLPPGTP